MSHSTQVLSNIYHTVLDRITSRPRNTGVTSTALALALSLAWVLSDFRAWKSFGTGGTPPTWAGYWGMTKIRFNRLLLFGKDDLTDPTPLSVGGPRYLDANAIGTREGDRPKIMARTMPQRQVPYRRDDIDLGVPERVSNMMSKFAARHSEILELKPSKTEGGSTEAIYAKLDLPTIKEEAKTDRILTSEIAHAHPADSSFHVWLSEADAKTVVEKGWGLRFPLSFVDKGWVMVYAPRTMAEVDVVEQIVKAGIGNVAGVKVY
jgi:hypothetical protein